MASTNGSCYLTTTIFRRTLVRNPAPDERHAFIDRHDDEQDVAYASDVRILAEPGGLRLTFTRTRVTEDVSGGATAARGQDAEVIARVLLPAVAARRLLRLLPKRLDLQQALAEDYDRETEEEAERDPFLVATELAEFDDEPYPEEQQAMAEVGWQEYLAGETVPWDDVKHDLLQQDDAPSRAAS